MIFVDSNVPMYLVGKEHPHKLEAQSLVERAVSAGEYLLSDAEVLQEICHRYKALRRLDMIQQGFDALLGLVEEVLPIERTDVEAARDIVLRYESLAARDAVHIAVMQRHGIERVMTFDRGFDAHPAVERVS